MKLHHGLEISDPPSEDAFRAWGPDTEEFAGRGAWGESSGLSAEKWVSGEGRSLGVQPRFEIPPPSLSDEGIQGSSALTFLASLHPWHPGEDSCTLKGCFRCFHEMMESL